MATNQLKTLLRKGLQPVEQRSTTRFREVVGMLRDTADVVDEFLRKGTDADVEVAVVQGQLVSDGLEHRIVVRSASHRVSDYLLRAYVPLDGYPVILDSADEDDAVYRSGKALQGALVGLVTKPWFQERLIGLREILRDPSMQQEPRTARVVAPVKAKAAPRRAKAAARRG